jgi:hypothetical protein
LKRQKPNPILCALLVSVAPAAFAQSTEENASQAMDELTQMEAAQTATTAQTPPAEAPLEEAIVETASTSAEAPLESEVAPKEAPSAADWAGTGTSEGEGKIVKTVIKAEEEKDSKPWKVTAGLGQSLGAGAFVSDEYARTTAYSYSISFGGSYKINDTFRASLGGSFDQQLTQTYDDGGTVPNEFYFRDLTAGLSAGSLYKEEITGISVGASGSFSIPASKSSIATGRITYAGAKLKLSRSFDDIGPGKISVGFSSSLFGALGAATHGNITASDAPSIFAACNDRDPEGNVCLGYYPNLSHAFSNNLNVSYSFLEDFSVSAWLGISNSFFRDISDSNVDMIQYDVRQSKNAVDETKRGDSVKTGLEFGYTLTENISLALSGATSTNPFIQNGADSTGLRFFLWDVESTASNRSSLNFDINFSY